MSYETANRLACIILLPLVAIVVLGLPVAIYHGLTTGDWTWLIPWGIVLVVLLGLTARRPDPSEYDGFEQDGDDGSRHDST